MTTSIPEIEQENFTVKELANYLRVTPSYIHRQCREGKLESFNIGTRRIIPARAVRNLIEAGYEDKEHDSSLCAYELDDGSPCMKRRIMYSDLCWSHTPR
jgi:excisionase family DNA binding protein